MNKERTLREILRFFHTFKFYLSFCLYNKTDKKENAMKKEAFINVMKRYELKFKLSKEQLVFFQSEILKHMKVDQYGLTTISSLYFDTPNYSLINKSIEKPKFKEKIRLRAYGPATDTSPVFLEVKRKLDNIVYKRRIRTTEKEVNEFLKGDYEFEKEQISRELKAFKEEHPNLEPKYLIIVDRTAYYQEDSDLRITIDTNPKYRTTKLDLHSGFDGIPLLEEGGAILEIKVQYSVPVWLSEILAKGKIYKTSFSKVGAAHILTHKKPVWEKTEVYQMKGMAQTKGDLRYGFTI